ncbi:MAG: BTAD domain-containing putative transcriptional regulator, partial [Anaerolineae bacterium]
MAHLSLSLLGSVQVTLDEEPVTGFKYDKVRALLAHLVVEADRPHRRDLLAGLLWPDRPERAARVSLRQSLAVLRRAIGDHRAEPPFLLVAHDTIQFNPAGDYWLDVAAFTSLLAACEAHPHRRLETCNPCSQRLRQAVELYHGDFLKGFFLGDSTVFEEWALIKREALHLQALDALHCLATYHETRGEYEPVRLYATRQVELEPWREDAHRQLIRVLAREGQRGAALAQYETCRRILAEELGVEPEEETTALYEQIRAGETSPPLLLTPAPLLELENPYKGLRAFRETDAPDFFGRETFTERLIEAVCQHPLVAVIGPSGSGKSSVIFAGLLPHLRQGGQGDKGTGRQGDHASTAPLPYPGEDTWLVADFRPGSRPFHHLAAALIPLREPRMGETEWSGATRKLAESLSQGYLSLSHVVARILQKSPATRLLLVADQFEELYTLCPEPEVRHRFLDTLLSLVTDHCSLVTDHCSLPTDHCSLVLTLRADFMGQALAYRPFADALQDAGLILGPMTRRELERAIEEPARGQGVTFEPGLVARNLDDVGEEPGNLPLLEFALTLLWEQPAIGRLTHAAYEDIGGVEGALARYADKVYAGLRRADQEQARRIFVQMVRPGEGTEDTRRLATHAELGENGWALVQRLADARLVVTDQDPSGQETVEVAHEALIQGWGRLRDWMNADRAFRAWQERLRAMLHQWEASDRDEGALLRGAPLAEAEGWLAEREGELSQAELDFIWASTALRERRRSARERRRQWIILGLATGLIIAVILTLLAAFQWRQAETQRQIALSNQLAAQALNRLDNQQFDLALLLSLEAYRAADTVESRSSLLTGLQRSPYRAVLRRHTKGVSSVTYSPDGKTLASGSKDGTIMLWDVAARRPTSRLLTCNPMAVNTIAFSPDSQTLVSGSDDGTIMLWDVATRQPLSPPLAGHAAVVESVAFSPDGRTLASGGTDKRIILWDVTTGQPIAPPLTGHTGAVKSTAFSPSGRSLASGSVDETWGKVDKTVVLWDISALLNTSVSAAPNTSAAAGQPTTEFLAGHTSNVSSVAFSPDGQTLASGGDDGTIILWDVATGQPIGEPLAHTSQGEDVPIVSRNVKLAFSPDGSALASGGADGTIILWDVTTRQPMGQSLAGHVGEVNALAFSPDGQTLASGGADNTIVLWTLGQPLARSVVEHSKHHHNIRVWSVAFSPDGQTLASGADDGTITLWDIATSQPIHPHLTGHTAGVNGVTFSPDGQTLATGSDDGTIILWDISMQLNTGVATSQPVGPPLTDHTDRVNSVAFSPDGRTLVSGSQDNTIILWDVASRQPLGPP